MPKLKMINCHHPNCELWQHIKKKKIFGLVFFLQVLKISNIDCLWFEKSLKFKVNTKSFLKLEKENSLLCLKPINVYNFILKYS